MILAATSSVQWPDTVAICVIALCVLGAFAAYRFTGGKWPD